eukprot:TRINITY_DN1937_c0_g1_i2.p1 TRINITY_DN1937_c0_g1~~TRINITY_DN1937_c0_g1_i2.p1  ORF type:complete len:366 (+),score=49.01 TRINITY_DN1937_c0_g1_i2:84-1181(+)
MVSILKALRTTADFCVSVDRHNHFSNEFAFGASLAKRKLRFAPVKRSSGIARPLLRKAHCVRMSSTTLVEPPKDSEDQKLKEGIADFYNASSGVWEDIWGEHMHHGFYHGKTPRSLADHKLAQIEMIERSLAFAYVPDDERRPKKIADIGCGIGGSSRYLGKKYGATVRGLTLSPFQAEMGNQKNDQQNLFPQVQLQVADAMQAPFPDGEFDLVWSMESGEHMPEKPKFVAELVRLVKPGGRIIIVTWCHRDLEEGETSLKPHELGLLQLICDTYYLPAWCSMADYVRLCTASGLQNVRSADWTENVTEFWPAVISTAFTWRGFIGLLKSGWATLQGALAMFLMVRGYSTGVIKFCIITGMKPSA